MPLLYLVSRRSVVAGDRAASREVASPLLVPAVQARIWRPAMEAAGMRVVYVFAVAVFVWTLMGIGRVIGMLLSNLRYCSQCGFKRPSRSAFCSEAK